MSGIPMDDKGWGEYDPDYKDMTRMIHVYPLNDLREHEVDGGYCWCRPKVDFDEAVIIHNAMDGREQWELGRKLS